MAKKLTKLRTQPHLTSHEDKPLVCPTKIGPYKVESFFNQGGMSMLYLGSHGETSMPLVIKVLSPNFIQNKEIVDRFLKEAQIIAMTDHPNIIKLYGQGTWEKGVYIAMEFINGVSLRQFILKKALSQKRALEIILQVAYALCHLHTHGVIHRDLKPENILITESGEVKVIDFGIAQLQGELSFKDGEEKKKIIGTPTYMSPEQKINPLNVSYNTDIFSLGVITYELILGHLSHGIIHLDLLPKELSPIIEKALKVNPKERYQDIVDFITNISQYLKSNFEEKELLEDPSSHILLSFEKTQNFLFPTNPPDWTNTDIGIAINDGVSLTGLYADFFKLPDGSSLIIVAEPLHEGVVSLIYTSHLKGIIKTLIHQLGFKKELQPVTFLQQINQMLLNDSEQKFYLNLLLLNADKEEFSFISCGYTPLFYIQQGSKKVTLLPTPNPLLGSDNGATLLSTAANWYVGDRLLLVTSEMLSNEKEATSHLAKTLTNTLLFPPKQQVKKIFNEMNKNFRKTFSKRGGALISIQRIF